MRWVRSFGALAVLSVLLGVAGVTVATPAGAATPSEIEQQFLDLLNGTRQLKGLAPLSADGLLGQTAREWSQNMANANRLSHDPNLAQVVTFVDPTWQKVGENVGVGGTVNLLWPAFMESAPHRANILGDFNKVGIGVVVDGRGTIWVTQRFLKGAPLPPPSGPPAPPDLVANTRYHPLPPARLLDTREGVGNVGGVKEKLGAGGVLDLAVVNAGGVPASGVTAVVVNVTVTNPSAPSHLTISPRGQSPRPNTSSLNFVAGQTVADLVVARVGSGGMVSVFNNAGEVDVIADVVGYFDAGTAGGARYTAVTPTRLIDTRSGVGAPLGKVGPGATVTVSMAGRSPLPASHITAVALNVTATNTTATSHLTVWPSDVVRPTASNLNFGPVSTVPNMVIAKLSATGQVSVFNNGGFTDVIADVVGFFDDGTTAATAYTALNPARVLDTRSGLGANGKVGTGQTITVAVANRGGVPASAKTVVLTVTATNPTAGSHVTVFPGDVTKPDASSLNFVAGQTVPNLVIVRVGVDGTIKLFNNAGSVDLLADVVGYLS